MPDASVHGFLRKLNGSSAAEYVREHGVRPELENLLYGLLGKRRT